MSIEFNALTEKRVHVGGVQLRVVVTNIVPTEIIYERKNDVRRRIAWHSFSQRNGNQQKQYLHR